MNRKRAVNFEELARHILGITDSWKRAQLVHAQPDGSLPEITKLITLCFGPTDAEAIARELIQEIELFEVEPDGDAIDPEAENRTTQLVKLLRQELGD